VNRAAREGLKVLLEYPERVLKQPKRIFRARRIETSTLKSDNDLVLPGDHLSPLGDMSPRECKRIAHAGSKTTTATLIALPARWR
jgi:hypothetical protein